MTVFLAQEKIARSSDRLLTIHPWFSPVLLPGVLAADSLW
jgi:hypothetical protein